MRLERKLLIAGLCVLYTCQPGATNNRGSSNNAGIEYHIPEGGSQSLNCSQPGSPSLETWMNVTWVLPDLTLVQRDVNHKFYDVTIFTLSDDGQVLLVENLRPTWYGDYYCMVMYEPLQFYVTRFGLNTSLYYADVLWLEYRHMVIIIGVAAGTLLALITLTFALIICCRRNPGRQASNDRRQQVNSVRRDGNNHSSNKTNTKVSVWEEYLGPGVDNGYAYPTSDKTI